MTRSLLVAAGLSIAISAVAEPPTDTAGGTGWFEARIADSLRRLQRERTSDRSRYAACGYVAPELTGTRVDETVPGHDSAFAAMLERLSAILRPAGSER